MCFVRSWYTEFAAIWMTLVLSPWSGVGSVGRNPSSEIRPRNHTILEQVADIALYSASIKDLETQSYFLHFQEINLYKERLSLQTLSEAVVDIPSGGFI